MKKSTLAQMWAPATLKSGQPVLVDGFKYGLGWFVRDTAVHRLVGHPGYSGTVMLRLVDDRVTIIVLTNLDVAAGSHPFILAGGIARFVRPDVVEHLKP